MRHITKEKIPNKGEDEKMWLNMMMAVCMYPALLLVYVGMKGASKNQKGKIFGATMKNEWLEQEETKQKLEEIRKSYHYHMKTTLIILACMPLLCFVIPYVSIQMTIWCIWLFIAIAWFEIIYVKAHQTLQVWKEENGWNAQVVQERYVELKAVGTVRKVKWTQFIAPLLICASTVISPIVFQKSDLMYADNPTNTLCFYVLWGTFLLSIVLFYLVAKWMDEKNVDVISTNSDININYTRAKKNVWKNMWILQAWLSAIFVVSMALIFWQRNFVNWMLWGTVIYTVIAVVSCIWVAGKLNQIEKRYEEKRDAQLFVDDDRYWLWGMIYYNPNDKRIMVEKRVGIGTEVNMATGFGKVLMAVGAVSILSVVVMCVWIMLEEFTPIDLQISQGNIVAQHVGLEYDIALEEIQKASIVKELPKMSKSNGSAMDNLKKGTFYVTEEERKCQVFLNPQNTCFIRLETADTIYYIGGVDDQQTQEIYQNISKK